ARGRGLHPPDRPHRTRRTRRTRGVARVAVGLGAAARHSAAPAGAARDDRGGGKRRRARVAVAREAGTARPPVRRAAAARGLEAAARPRSADARSTRGAAGQIVAVHSSAGVPTGVATLQLEDARGRTIRSRRSRIASRINGPPGPRRPRPAPLDRPPRSPLARSERTLLTMAETIVRN